MSIKLFTLSSIVENSKLNVTIFVSYTNTIFSINVFNNITFCIKDCNFCTSYWRFKNSCL